MPLTSRASLPRPNLSVSEAGGLIAVWLMVMFAPNGPLTNRYSAGIILSFIFTALLTRNVMAIGAVTFFLSLACRFLFSSSAWVDQRWIQWYSASSLLTGHNIYIGSPLVGMSMSAYMPMGDLFGGVLIALGIQKYWVVWHVIVCCLLAVPVVASPGVVSLAVFITTANIFAFYDYTTAGGSLEITFAVLIAAISFYRAGYITAAVVGFAFAANLRQPDALIVPFVLVLLWKERDWRNIRIFSGLLLLFGGVYILLDPRGFYLYSYKLFDLYNQMYFNEVHGLLQNYTISSIPHLFGVNDLVPWREWSAVYLPVTLASIGVLLWIAWRAKSRDNILTLAVLATLFVYILVRGYSFYHYVLATALPMAAILTPTPARKTWIAGAWARGMSVVLLWFGLMPFLFFVRGRLEGAVQSFYAAPPVTVAATRVLEANGVLRPVANLDGRNEHRQELWLNQDLEFSFPKTVHLSAVRLSGDHVQIQKVKGVDILWASDTESKGAITEGDIQYSLDGGSFQTLRPFTLAATYSAFPVTLMLPRTASPIRAIRIHARNLYLDQRQWILGNVEFFGNE